MKKNEMIESLRLFSLFALSSSVANDVIKRIPKIKFKRRIALEFFSLGDLLKGVLLLQVLRSSYPEMYMEISVSEEYFDEEGVLELIAEQYACFITSPGSSKETFKIGAFDSKVSAYKMRSGDFDFVFPTHILAPLHVASDSQGKRNKLRKLWGIASSEKVLCIGCFSSTPLTDINLWNIQDEAIRKDFEQTHLARYISNQHLKQFLKVAVEESCFDKIFLVPRNVTEEIEIIEDLSREYYCGVVSENDASDNQSPVVVIAAKGILRGAYVMSDACLVMGFHNVLEPHLCNPMTATFCVTPPITSPNRFLFDAGCRLGILDSIAGIPDQKCQSIQLLNQMRGRLEDENLNPPYYEDELYQSSMSKVIDAFTHLIKILNNKK